MATVARTAPISMTGANRRPSSAPVGAADPPAEAIGQQAAPRGDARRGDDGHATLAHQSDHNDHGTGQAGDEGQPDPDSPERSVQHKTTFPLLDFTRFGLAAQ